MNTQLAREGVFVARHEATRNLAALPGILAAVLPKAACPVCVAAYAGAVSALGLGFLLTDRVLNPIIVGSLALSVVSVAWAARQRRRTLPLYLAVVGAAAIILGRMIWSVPLVVYVGMALLLGASLWTLWVRRPQPAPLVNIRFERKEGIEP